MQFPEEEFKLCSEMNAGDNGKRMDVWVVSNKTHALGASSLSLLKGKRAHLVNLQDGSISTGTSGRFRTGFWEGGRQHFSSMSMLVDGKRHEMHLRKYVRQLHSTYRQYRNVERLDFIQHDAPGLCIALKSDGKHEVSIRFRASHKTMWPQEHSSTDFTFEREADSYVLSSSVNATRFSVSGEGATVSFRDGWVEANFPRCSKAMLFVSSRDMLPERFNYELLSDYHSRVSRECILETPDFAFNKTFLWAKHDLLEFYTETEVGNGFYAGFPEFSWFFGRDGEWMSLAATECGMHDLAIEHLETLKRAADGGRIPHEIPLVRGTDGNPARSAASMIQTGYRAIDSTPLWIICQTHLSRWTDHIPDMAFMRQALDFCKSCDRDGDGLIENRSSENLIGWPESWADRRDGPCIDANAWWREALKRYSLVSGEEGELLRRCADAFESTFFRTDGRDFVADSISADGPRFIKNACQIVPSMYEKGGPYSRLVEFLGDDDTLIQWGMRSVSSDDPTYDMGYHTGQVWPLMTGWLALAAYSNSLPEIGFRALSSFPLLSFSAQDPGRICESFHPEYLLRTGQFAQGWSASLYVQSVVEGLFGVSPSGESGREELMHCTPHLPAGWRSMTLKRLRYRGSFYDLKVTRGGLTVTRVD